MLYWVIIWEVNIIRLMSTLRTAVNFINILCANFVPIFWRQKITKPKVSRVMLLNLISRVNCWWNWLLLSFSRGAIICANNDFNNTYFFRKIFSANSATPHLYYINYTAFYPTLNFTEKPIIISIIFDLCIVITCKI